MAHKRQPMENSFFDQFTPLAQFCCVKPRRVRLVELNDIQLPPFRFPVF
jgi:hypothetical protein